jgi:hypothetical protein
MRSRVWGALLLAASVSSAWAIEPGLYAIQSSDSTGSNGVWKIDAHRGTATKIADLSVQSSLCGATFLDGELYASDLLSWSPDQFYGTVDVETGVFTGIHDQAFDLNWHGLASSDALGVTWAISQQNNKTLVQTDRDGNMTVIGPTGIDGRGMAYDDTHGILYATNYDDSGLYSIDITTGQATHIGDTGVRCDLVGLAYDEWTQTLYLNEADVTNSLYTVDVNTGAATLVGPNGYGLIDGLAWIPEPTSWVLMTLGMLIARRR